MFETFAWAALCLVGGLAVLLGVYHWRLMSSFPDHWVRRVGSRFEIYSMGCDGPELHYETRDEAEAMRILDDLRNPKIITETSNG